MISQDRALSAIVEHLAREKDTPSLIAPAGTRDCQKSWEGRIETKPWNCTVTAAIPHLNTPETIKVVIELLRRQTIKPYIMVIDTGSSPDVCTQIELMRTEDVEIHYIKSHAYYHPSMPVTAAMDLAFALCQTKLLFATHTDVFPRKRSLITEMVRELTLSNAAAVGYEMSPRPGTNKWKGVLSHTCTLFNMKEMRKNNIQWNLFSYFEKGNQKQEAPGWPDTESGLAQCLKERELPIKLIGKDVNEFRYIDNRIDHSRSYTGSTLHCEGTEIHKRAQNQMKEALREAEQRIKQWDEIYGR